MNECTTTPQSIAHPPPHRTQPPPPQVHFEVGEEFRVEDLLRLQLHKYAEDVAEIVDRAQKEEKMETVGGRGGGSQ